MDDFTKKLNNIINHGYTAQEIVLGSQLGLFEHISSAPRSYEEIANAAKCKPRYIKEWLSAMVCAKIVDTQDGQTFSMPEGHRALFIKSDTIGLAGYLPMLSETFKKIAQCFKLEGPGGTTYNDYERFYEKTPTARDPTSASHIYNDDPSIKTKFENGCRYLDVGCGWGSVTHLFAKQHALVECFGIDIIPEAIKDAKLRVIEDNVTNLTYFVMDASQMLESWSSSFDYVTTFDAIYDQANPEKVLKEIYRILKPSGIYSMVDIDASSNLLDNKNNRTNAEILYTISLFHCMPISLGPMGNGKGLGTMWGRQWATEMLEEAGFCDIKFYTMCCDMGNYHCVCKKQM